VSDTVTAAIYDAGFNSNGRFYANASEVLGMAPTDFREGCRTGHTLRHSRVLARLGSDRRERGTSAPFCSVTTLRSCGAICKTSSRARG
jgi:hypothetical protein